MGNQGGKKKVTSRVAGFVLVIFGFFQFQSFYRQFHSIHSFIHSSSCIITYRPSLLGEAVYRIESKSNRFVRVDVSCTLPLHQKICNSGSIRLFDLPARVRTDLFSRSCIIIPETFVTPAIIVD